MKYLISENNFVGSDIIIVYVISIIAIFFGIYVIISKNPILSVLFLIGLFSSVAVYLVTIGLHFIGLSYLLVYIGAVSILFLFILMLINVRISELVTDNKNSIPLAILILLFFNYSISNIIPYSISKFNLMNNNFVQYISLQDSIAHYITSSNTLSNEYISLTNLGSVKAESWQGVLAQMTHITSIGNILYTNLFILFIITSLILLLAMVGAIIITINKSLSSVKSANFNNIIKH